MSRQEVVALSRHVRGAALRRRILRLVWDVERTLSERADQVGLSRPATPQHLRVVREVELVEVREEGRDPLYPTREGAMADMRSFLEEFWGSGLTRLKAAAEERAPEERS